MDIKSYVFLYSDICLVRLFASCGTLEPRTQTDSQTFGWSHGQTVGQWHSFMGPAYHRFVV